MLLLNNTTSCDYVRDAIATGIRGFMQETLNIYHGTNTFVRWYIYIHIFNILKSTTSWLPISPVAKLVYFTEQTAQIAGVAHQ